MDYKKWYKNKIYKARAQAKKNVLERISEECSWEQLEELERIEFERLCRKIKKPKLCTSLKK